MHLLERVPHPDERFLWEATVSEKLPDVTPGDKLISRLASHNSVSEGRPMPGPMKVKAAPQRPPEQTQLIVARDSLALCQALQEPFAARGKFTVVVDRRRAERRNRVEPVLEERRRRDRRSRPSLAEDLRLWPYVLVRPRYGLPSSAMTATRHG